MTEKPMLDISEFYVIAVVSNPIRYKRRWELFKQFKEHMKDMGAQVLVVEQAFGRRQPQIATDYDQNDNCVNTGPYIEKDPFHLVVRTDQELWYKENLINLRNCSIN